MPLPVAPSPKKPTHAISSREAVVARVAWTLRGLDLSLTSDVIDHAVEHARLQIPTNTPLEQAEELATHQTTQFVVRARGHLPSSSGNSDWRMPPSKRWRTAIANATRADTVTQNVFFHHYGCGRPIGSVPGDEVAVQGAQTALRGLVRRLAREDGHPVADDSDEAIDRVLLRMVALSHAACPPAREVVAGAHARHRATCIRCLRIHALVHTHQLDAAKLEPLSSAPRPHKSMDLLLLEVRDGSRKHRELLATELSRSVGGPEQPVHRIGDRYLYVHVTRRDHTKERLTLATQMGMPPRHQLRGVLHRGVGRWTPHGPIGALPDRCENALKDQEWGLVAGLCGLPEPLPEPPSATSAWLAVAALAATAFVVHHGATHAQRAHVTSALSAAFTEAREGTLVSFDLPDQNYLSVVTIADGTPAIAFRSTTPADKAELATGDGSYTVHVPGDGLWIASTDAPLTELDRWVTNALNTEAPFEVLSRSLGQRGEDQWFAHASADVEP